MAKGKGTHFVVTANLTDDGDAAYLRADGTWARDLGAAVALDRENAEARLRDARREERVVCDPYVFDVVLRDGVPSALTMRERIRNAGPTTPLRRPDAG